MYELLIGYTPFCGEGTETSSLSIYSNIKSHVYPLSVESTKRIDTNAGAVDLINRLLHHNQLERFGCCPGSRPNNIKKHCWFSGFDFAALVERRLTPPYIPPAKDRCDICVSEGCFSLSSNVEAEEWFAGVFSDEPHDQDPASWDIAF